MLIATSSSNVFTILKFKVQSRNELNTHTLTEILTEIYVGHPCLITALFEIRPVAYFGPKQNTFEQKKFLYHFCFNLV